MEGITFVILGRPLRGYIHTIKNDENGALQFLPRDLPTVFPEWLSHNFPDKVFVRYSDKKCANTML